MPLVKYIVEYYFNDEIIKKEAESLKKLALESGLTYDVLQKKCRYGDKYRNKKIISITKELIQEKKDKIKKKYPVKYNYVKKVPEITYHIIIDGETFDFHKLSEGSKLLKLSIPTVHRILKSEIKKNKYNITETKNINNIEPIIEEEKCI